MKKKDYAKYLLSRHWKVTRRAALIEHGRRCNKCRSHGTRFNPLQVHHKTYARLGEEDIKRDLVVLCRSCHNSHHKHTDFDVCGLTEWNFGYRCGKDCDICSDHHRYMQGLELLLRRRKEYYTDPDCGFYNPRVHGGFPCSSDCDPCIKAEDGDAYPA